MSLPRILFISDLLPDQPNPSILHTSVALADMCSQWKAQGAKLMVIKPKWLPKKGLSTQIEAFNYKDLTIHQVPIPRLPKTYSTSEKWLVSFLEKEGFKPDIMVTHMVHGIRVGSKLKEGALKDTHWVAGIHFGDLKLLREKSGLIKKPLQHADAIWTRAPWLREELSHLLKRDIDSIGLCISGISPSEILEPYAVHPKWENLYSRKKLDLVLAGTLTKQKHYDQVLKALGAFKGMDWFLHIFGTGPEMVKLNQLARKYEIKAKLIFHGLQPRYRVLEFMRKCHIHLMPGENETLGLTYLEAAAQGCANVGLIHAGIDGVFKNGHDALLLERPEASQILKVLDQLSKDPEPIHTIAIRGWERVRELTWDKVAKDQLQFLQAS